MSRRLTTSKNTKTTPRIRTRHDGRATAYPMFANSFGLPSHETCPGKTQFCDDFCYATETEGRTNVRIAMQNNLELLQDKSEDEMYALLAEMINDYQSQFTRKKLPENENVFRIHWDGDFFSNDYARAWARVIQENPQIMFWVYTRSFREPVNVVPDLYGIRNLALYLSVDEGNVEDAKLIRREYPKILMAFCAEDQYRAEQVAAEAGKQYTTACPENIGKIALHLNGHGACIECGLCPKKRPNILFVDSKTYDLRAQLLLFDVEPVPVRLKTRDRGEGVAPSCDDAEPAPMLW